MAVLIARAGLSGMSERLAVICAKLWVEAATLLAVGIWADLATNRVMQRFIPLWVALALVIYGFALFKMGGSLKSIYEAAWEAERDQVARWRNLLCGRVKGPDVVEIRQDPLDYPEPIYRILNARDCWAMATFMDGKDDKPPATFAILESNAVTLVKESDGTQTAIVKGEVIRNALRAAT